MAATPGAWMEVDMATTPRAVPPFAIMALRALTLRCPRCGGRGILRNWFNLKHHCPSCDLVFNRGESGDYWLGGYNVNFIVAETTAVIGTGIYVVATLTKDRESTRLNSSHANISYAVFCLKKKNK